VLVAINIKFIYRFSEEDADGIQVLDASMFRIRITSMSLLSLVSDHMIPDSPLHAKFASLRLVISVLSESADT